MHNNLSNEKNETLPDTEQNNENNKIHEESIKIFELIEEEPIIILLIILILLIPKKKKIQKIAKINII